MKFFMPAIQDSKQAEEMYQNIKTAVQKAVPCDVSDRRVFRIAFTLKRMRHEAEVGETIRLDREEVVAAIFESPTLRTYLICTKSRGIHGNMPHLIGYQDVSTSEDFEV
jgi:hypothetical protein